MDGATLGYDKDLFVLPFDHRGSFESGLMGIRDRQAEPVEVAEITGLKRVIYDGLLRALEGEVPRESAALLVDQKYGEAILADAPARGIITCAPVEKSGQDEFDFEYGEEAFGRRLQDSGPTFAKALVRYNPRGDAASNDRQRRRLRVLSDYCHAGGYKLMFELLVPATPSQLDSTAGDRRSYDLDLRPALMIQAMAELQQVGIEPDVWKLEGLDQQQAARDVVAQARSGGRSNVGVIVLGRGEDEARVREWLAVAAPIPGVVGFAVGRTVFWRPLVHYKEAAISRPEAVDRIAGNYQAFHGLFVEARAGQVRRQG